MIKWLLLQPADSSVVNNGSSTYLAHTVQFCHNDEGMSPHT